LIAVDGKEPRPGPGDALLSAVTVPSQFSLGSALVDTKTHEIPAARARFGQLGLAGRWVALDPLHTQDETARQLVLEPGAHYLLTVKNNQPTLRQNMARLIPVPPTGFSPSGPDAPPRARTGEKNKGAPESRTLESRPVAAEDLGFPFAAQAARLTRHRVGRKDETVGLITDLAPEDPPLQRLQANRQGWGIGNGTHQRLDVSLHDDRCRVRSTNGLWLLGRARRLVISLFMEGRARQAKPHFQSLTDFQTAMEEDNLAKALRFVTHRRPPL